MVKMIYILGILMLLSFVLVSSINNNDKQIPKGENNTVKVIIELKEEPIVQANKRLGKELDKSNKMKLHKNKIDNEHKKIKDKLFATYKVKKIKREYKHLFNGFAIEVTQEKYEELLQDEDIKKVWIDEILFIQTVQMNDTVAEINADDLWAIEDDNGVNITGVGTTVAILDTGILYNHSDLGNCSYKEVDEGNCDKIEYMWDFVNNDNNSLDDSGHGTHVAGTVGANGRIKGVAPNTTFMVYKVCNAVGDCDDSDIIAGIENATMRDADVISISIGGSGYSNDVHTSIINGAMANGTLVVIAAGNEYSLFAIGKPGATLSALTVGASCLPSQLGDPNCISATEPYIATFSSKGFVLWSNGSISGIKPDILAPGVGLNSTYHSGVNEYALKSGTSMATPHISGVAALLKQAHPDWNSYELKSAIVNYAIDLNYSYRKQGAGLVDAIRSYNASLLIHTKNYKTSMIYFGDNFNSSIALKNFSTTINITNKWGSSVTFNLSITNYSGINFISDIGTDSELLVNESILININLTLNNSVLTTGMFNNSFKLITNISQNISIPYAFYTILNTDDNCPSVGETTNISNNQNLTLPRMNCSLPDWRQNSVFLFVTETTNATLDCNGSIFDGVEPIPANAVPGSMGVLSTSSWNVNLTVKNCHFKNYGTGIYFNNLGFNTRTGESYIENNIVEDTTDGIKTECEFTKCIIKGNIVNRATDEAIMFDDSGNSTAINNTVYNSKIGLYWYGSILPSSGVITGLTVENGTSDANYAIVILEVDGLIVNDSYTYNVGRSLSGYKSNITILDSQLDAGILSLAVGVSTHITSVNTTFNSTVAISPTDAFLKNKYYLTVNVTNTTNEAISGATVTVTDDNGTIDWTDTTDSNGLITNKPTIDYFQNSSDLYNHTNLAVTATATSYNTTTETISMDDNKEIIMMLEKFFMVISPFRLLGDAHFMIHDPNRFILKT